MKVESQDQALHLSGIDMLNDESRTLVLWGVGDRFSEVLERLTGQGGPLRKPDFITDSTRSLSEPQIMGIPVLPFNEVRELDPYNTSLIVTAGILDLPARIIPEELYYFDIRHCRSIEFYQHLVSDWPWWLRSLDAFSSDESRDLYQSLAGARIFGTLFDPSLYSPNPYVGNDLVRHIPPNSRILFAGAFNGKHVERFLSVSPNVSVAAFEPSPTWFRNLVEKFTNREEVTLQNALLWNHSGTVPYFNDTANGGRSARIVEVGALFNDTIDLDTVVIDDIFQQQEYDFMFLDVEGAEFEALEGATHTMKKFSPSLGICSYHSPRDFVRLPHQLRSYLGPRYQIEVRHHSAISQIETVVYAISPRHQN